MALSHIVTLVAVGLCWPISAHALTDCVVTRSSESTIVAVKAPDEVHEENFKWTLDGIELPDLQTSLEIDGQALHGGHHRVSAMLGEHSACSVEIDLEGVTVDHVAYEDPYPRSRDEKTKLALRRRIADQAAKLNRSAMAFQASTDRMESLYSKTKSDLQAIRVRNQSVDLLRATQEALAAEIPRAC
jgi:hypothetical protein